MNEEICPVFNTCFVGNMLKSLEIEALSEYCRRNYAHCKYFSLPAAEGCIDFSEKEAAV